MKQKRFHWLADMVKTNSFTTGAEVGAAIGITTKHLLDNCPSLKVLTIVDLWEPVPGSSNFDRPDMEQVFRSKFENEKRIIILKGISWEVPTVLSDESFDFVFIDASHDYQSVLNDIVAWMPKIKSGGILCGHDLHFPGVRQALEELFEGNYQETGIDNVWYVQV